MSSSAPASPTEQLNEYVAIWSSTIDDVLTLLDDLDADDWSLPTDLPGWSVHDVAAHLAHLEHLLAGGAHDDVEIGSPEHVSTVMDQFTEQGIVARRDHTPAEIIAELRSAVTTRRSELTTTPPTDPEAAAPGLFGAIGWNMATLLRNRPLDVWMHEQDIRRAGERPGNLDSPAALHTVRQLAGSLPMVLGKRVKAAPGSSVALEVDGVGRWTALIGEDGRAHLTEDVDSPTATLHLDVETFALLAGGRRSADEVLISGAGDSALAMRVARAMAVTP